MIYNDRDASIILDQLLISRPTHPYYNSLKTKVLTIVLKGKTDFTKTGASKLAKRLCALDERPIVHVRIASRYMDFKFVQKVVKIIYLEGNKPELYVFDSYHERPETFNNLCRQLQQNHQSLKEYTYKSLGNAASIQFGMSLHGNTVLQKLTLQDFTLGQARALPAGISNSAMTTLVINNLSFDGCKLGIICQFGIRASGRLWNLTISAPAEMLKTIELAEIAPCLQSLTLENVNMGLPSDQSQFQILCEGLGGHTSNLLGLTLQQCRMDDGAMTILANGLHNLRSMKTLNVADNRIGDNSIAAFVDNWPEDSELEVLDLGYNLITSDGLQRLMTALPNRRAMKTLNLMRNAFGCDGVEIIGNHLPNLNLREIMIGEVSMVDQAARTQAMNSCLRGIHANYFLRHLDIRGYSLPQLEFKDEITLFTELNKYGRRLLIADNVPPALWCLILAKARIEREFSLSMIFYFLVEQPPLVNERQGGKRRKRQTTAEPTKRRSARLRLSMD